MLSKKKIITLISSVLILIFSFAFSHLAPKTSTPVSQASVPNAPSQTASAIQSTQPTADTYPVTRVVDGDTIVVNIAGMDTKVRLIGVNTPETVDPRKKVQCFGKEASNYVKGLLTGKSVRLEADLTQSDTDKYGRLLRYVYLGDVLVNQEIIQEGFGYEYTYNTPYTMQKEFKASQAYASAGSIGLWSPDSCGGKL